MPYADRGVQKQYHADYYKKGTDIFRDRNYRINYGIGLSDYNEILEKQGFSCALCEIHMSDLKYILHVDHCHKSGKIRGLLCMKCNAALGMLGDDEEGLLKAYNYIRGDL